MSFKQSHILAGVVLAGAAVLPSVACAQYSFDLLTRFAAGWGEDAQPIDGKFQVSKPGVYNFELQEGVFNAVGFTNYGVANWLGEISCTEPGLTQPLYPRPTPFNQMGRDGVVREDGTRIEMIDSAHPWEQFHYTDVPPLPRAIGAEEYVAIYRFSLVIDDLTPRELELRAESTGLSRPLNDWRLFINNPPDPETGEPGWVQYNMLALPPETAQTAELSFAFIEIIPSPGAAGAMGLFGLLAVRRRR
jgi:hypothetical protein